MAYFINVQKDTEGNPVMKYFGEPVQEAANVTVDPTTFSVITEENLQDALQEVDTKLSNVDIRPTLDDIKDATDLTDNTLAGAKAVKELYELISGLL